MELVIERRAARGNEITDLALHPVLRRAYAARGVRDSQELALTLDRLMPVGTLDSVEAAVGADPRASRAAHPRRRRFRRRWRHQHRAHRALPARLGIRVGRFPRAQPLRVRLRPHARNRRARGRAQSVAHHHRRQRHLQQCRCRGRACARHPGAGHRSSSARAVVAGRRCHRESQCARQHASVRARSPASASRST